MAVRPIDANAMLSELRPISFEAEHSAVLLSDVSKMMREWVERQPTLTPPNEPLTIEQLREMDRFSPPIWDECLHEWCAVRPNGCDGQQRVSYIGGGCRPLESGRFYRRPPEGET